MKRSILVLAVFMAFCPVWAGVLYLKNGQKITYRDNYEIKDGYVCFHDASGNYLKLPVKLVDLEATEAHAEKVHTQTEEDSATSDDEAAREDTEQGYLPDRFYKNEAHTTEITKQTVAKHKEPRSNAAWTPPTRKQANYTPSPEEQKALNRLYRSAYTTGLKRIKRLEQELDKAEVKLNRLYDQRLDPDRDPPQEDRITKLEFQITQLKEEIQREKDRLIALVKEGRRQGAKNITVPLRGQ